METVHTRGTRTTAQIEPVVLDALIIGAGVAGLYELHQLRNQGLKTLAVDSAADVGGTWYWNRYPGARFDSEGYIYQYFFDEDLYKDWTWSERFPSQPEIERWMHYVTDRLDLRRDIVFSNTVTSAEWNRDTERWIVRTDKGLIFETQFVISCMGALSAPLEERFPGQRTFNGEIFHTARWPRESLDFKDKRVGVVGIGATGIQIVQTIAGQVGQLKVFVRTPQYTLPMKNPKYGPDEAKRYKSRFEDLRATLPWTFAGFEYDFAHKWADLTPEQRLEVLQSTFEDGSMKFWLASFAEMFFDPAVNEQVSEFVRSKMRARLKDQRLIDILVPGPDDYGFGTHRVPLETNFLEAFLRHNVEAVSVKDNHIVEIVPDGIKLADGTVHELDIIILATGFDASSGALARIDIRGRGGRRLQQEWSRDIRTTMGLMIHGYPNLFLSAAPLAPSSALCNMTTCLQQQTEWNAALIRHMRGAGKTVVEPSAAFQEAWVEHNDEVAKDNLITKTASWYTGANVEGKPRRILAYTGGVGTYRQKCIDLAENGYPGFEMA